MIRLSACPRTAGVRRGLQRLLAASLCVAAIALSLVGGGAQAVPSDCGRPSCTKKKINGNDCEECRTPQCEMRPNPSGGPPQQVIVGVKTTTSCTVAGRPGRTTAGQVKGADTVGLDAAGKKGRANAPIDVPPGQTSTKPRK